MTASILVVDDDAAVGKMLRDLISQEGYDVAWVSSASEALETLNQRYIQLVLTDLRMPNIDGMELLQKVRAGWPDVQVVMISAHGTVAVAVEAMKHGASDFIQKPFDREEILRVVKKELARKTGDAVPQPTVSAQAAEGLGLGTARSMRECDEELAKAAKSASTVLLRGESGVGKELAAHAIHDRSKRRAGPFVVFQATSLDDNLLLSELFGHEKGAFTGAVSRKPGRVELAAGGTLFLDELGDMSLSAQEKLLRLI